MFGFDAIQLARTQFAFTVIVFPAPSIGLASYLMVLEGLWLRTGRAVHMDLFRYWLKVFSLAFGMGVVSGLVMSYQFGTNWSVFSDKAGVIGPLMGYEVLSALFLEAGFLGIMLFGMERVGRGLHFAATCIVAFGTLFSAFWILSVNSWMQAPAGYRIAGGATWLVWRTEGALQRRCRGYARVLGPVTLALIGVVSLWTPLLNSAFQARWFGWPGIALTSPVPVLLAFLAWRFWRGLAREEELSRLSKYRLLSR